MSFFSHLIISKEAHIPPKRISPSKIQKSNNKSFITRRAPKILKKRRDNKRPQVDNNFDLTEYDILKIDLLIRSKLSREYDDIIDTSEELPMGIYAELDRFKWIVENSRDPVDVIQAHNRVIDIRDKIRDIEQGFELIFYISQTEPILTKYRRIISSKKRDFIGVQIKDLKTEIEREHLIQDFLRVAQKYIHVGCSGDTYVPSSSLKHPFFYCKQCFSTKFEMDMNSGEKICKYCALSTTTLDDSPCFKDSDRVNMSSRYRYVCKSHFIAAMDQFEGKQNSNITKVLEVIKEEMKNYNLSEKTLTKKQIYMFLSDKKLSSRYKLLSDRKLSDHYKDINLIFLKLTGKEPPDISSIRDVLLKMYDKVQKVYEDVKSPERQSSLNVGFIFRNLLWLLDFRCSSDNFFFLKTPTKAREHSEKWNEMIEELKKRYPNDRTPNNKPMWRHLSLATSQDAEK